jgi:hypothetical protein
MLNVLDYGAAGDGTTDDTAVIQGVLDIAAGGGTVYIPAGSYSLTSTLFLRSGTTILASGAYLFGAGNHRLLANFRSTDNFPGYTGNGDIVIDGGVWDVKGQTIPMGSVGLNVMSFAHASHIRLENVTLRNTSWAHACEFNAINHGTWVNCRAEGFTDTNTDPAVDRQKAEAFQIDMAAEGSTSLAPFDNTPCKNITVERCYAGPSAEMGSWGALTGSHTGKGLNVWYDDIKVLDSTADGTLKYAVHGECWRDPIIRGNYISGSGGTSIFLDSCVGGIVTANSVRDAGSNGINCSRTNGTVITGNSINNPTNHAIYLDQASYGVVTSNYCYGGDIYKTASCTGVSVVANVIR